MIQYKKFVFNPLQVNCWLVYDESGACVIFDPSCISREEQNELSEYIYQNELKPLAVVITHGHFDHVPGVGFVVEEFGCPFMGHLKDLPLVEFAPQQASVFGVNMDTPPIRYDRALVHKEILVLGQMSFAVLHVPGHSEGSLAFYSRDGGFIIVGDVLFKGSIGRTDLPGGDYNTLINSIQTHLLVLPESTIVMPGHGHESTIGAERDSNPFLR